MIIYPILAGLFAIGVIVNLFKDPPDWPNIWVGAGLAIALIAMWMWLRVRERKSRETLDWIEKHRAYLTDQPQYFQTSPFPEVALSNDLLVRDFKVVTSCLVYTSTHNLGIDLRSSFARGLIASLWTLLFGWWGLPWGPVRTVQALGSNLSGGEKMELAEALRERSKAPVESHP